ncbi:hypothetical protein [Acinetobacter bereziniae]|uniref:hypothetical protein n=1 Tax=Acinetobacter bereziniae TaxID=106648 RepID=UPI0019025086|nr:hypothetical protein [Acinetobacter bereziniae]MBJ8553300.1 hypothetical protein [Acinetobacter bereziniae]
MSNFQSGYSYLYFMVLTIFLSFFLSNSILIYSTFVKGERDRELIRISDSYCNALKSYFANSPNGIYQYPEKIDFLLRDPRYKNITRYLRRLEVDPISRENFILVKNDFNQVIDIKINSIDDINNLKLIQDKFKNYNITKYNEINFCRQ